MSSQASAIKVLAVVTAAPRWIGALLAAEGLAIPQDWMPWWTIVSVVMAAAMAGVEGWAFSYVFSAWRNQHDQRANRLLWLAVLAAIAFVVVLAPYVAAQVRSVPLTAILSHNVLLWAWAVAVAASTITIVALVGYAQKQARPTQSKKTSESKAKPKRYPAACEFPGCNWSGEYTTKAGATNALNGHSGVHQFSDNGQEIEAEMAGRANVSTGDGGRGVDS